MILRRALHLVVTDSLLWELLIEIVQSIFVLVLLTGVYGNKDVGTLGRYFVSVANFFNEYFFYCTKWIRLPIS